MSKLTVYIDCVSPYAYFAFETCEAYRDLWNNVEIDYAPLSLGIVMKESGNSPPITVPNKGKWLTQDVKRTRECMGLDKFEAPRKFPYNSLKAQRVLQAVKMGEPAATFVSCARSFWKAGWSDHEDMSSPDVLVKALSTVLDAEKAKEYVKKADDPDVKAQLLSNTKHALENGAFGLPYICAERDGKEEWFFGSDRWHHITRFLGVDWRGQEYVQNSRAKL